MPFSRFKNSQRSQIDDLLMRHADALIAGNFDADYLFSEYDAELLRQANELLALGERLNAHMREVSPSEQFIRRLYHELLDGVEPEQLSLWGRVRHLPPRTQIAAAAGIGGAATLTAAGVVLIAFRPKLGPLEYLRNRFGTIA